MLLYMYLMLLMELLVNYMYLHNDVLFHHLLHLLLLLLHLLSNSLLMLYLQDRYNLYILFRYCTIHQNYSELLLELMGMQLVLLLLYTLSLTLHSLLMSFLLTLHNLFLLFAIHLLCMLSLLYLLYLMLFHLHI